MARIFGKRKRNGIRQPRIQVSVKPKELKILQMESKLLGKPIGTILVECFKWDFNRPNLLEIPSSIEAEFLIDNPSGKQFRKNIDMRFDLLSEYTNFRTRAHKAGISNMSNRVMQYARVMGWVRPLAVVRYIYASEMLAVFERVYWEGKEIPGKDILQKRIEEARKGFRKNREEEARQLISEGWKKLCFDPIKPPVRKPKPVFTEGCEIVSEVDDGEDDYPLFVPD